MLGYVRHTDLYPIVMPICWAQQVTFEDRFLSFARCRRPSLIHDRQPLGFDGSALTPDYAACCTPSDTYTAHGRQPLKHFPFQLGT